MHDWSCLSDRLLSYSSTPFSMVTARHSTKLCHNVRKNAKFENRRQNLAILPLESGVQNCLFTVVLRRYGDISANTMYFRTKRATHKYNKIISHSKGSLNSLKIWRIVAHKCVLYSLTESTRVCAFSLFTRRPQNGTPGKLCCTFSSKRYLKMDVKSGGSSPKVSAQQHVFLVIFTRRILQAT